MGGNCYFCLVKVAKRPRVARGCLGTLGQARAGFWVMENGSSGGAGLDICRYLQLSHQVFHTPQSLRRADLQQWRSLSRYLQRFGRKMSLLLSKSSQTVRGCKRVLGQAWEVFLGENGWQQWRSLSRYLQLSHHSAVGFTAVAELA